MKKYILSGIAALAVAAAVVVNVNLNSQSHALSTISLANVEALAGENDDGVAEIIRTDQGRATRTIDGIDCDCRINHVSCDGKGSYSCQSGYFYDDCVRIIIYA